MTRVYSCCSTRSSLFTLSYYLVGTVLYVLLLLLFLFFSKRDYTVTRGKKIFKLFVLVSSFKSDNLNSKQMFALVIRSRSQITLHAAKKVSISYFFSPFLPAPPFFVIKTLLLLLLSLLNRKFRKLFSHQALSRAREISVWIISIIIPGPYL